MFFWSVYTSKVQTLSVYTYNIYSVYIIYFILCLIHNGQQLSQLPIGHRYTFTDYSYEEVQSSTYFFSHWVLMIKIHKHFSWESPLGMANKQQLQLFLQVVAISSLGLYSYTSSKLAGHANITQYYRILQNTSRVRHCTCKTFTALNVPCLWYYTIHVAIVCYFNLKILFIKYKTTGMGNWNQHQPERYSNFCGIYIKFQGRGMWPWTCWGRRKSQGHCPHPSPVIKLTESMYKYLQTHIEVLKLCIIKSANK